MTMIPLEQQLKPFIFLVLIVCFVSLNIIFGKTNSSIGNRKAAHAFKGMLVSFMIYCLVDLRLLIGDAFYTALPRLVVLFVVSLGFGVMSFSCYFWFKYVYADSRRPQKSKKIANMDTREIVYAIPLAIDLLILFTPLHFFAYELTDTIAVFKPFLLFVLLMDYVYLIAATVISVKNLKKARTRAEKKKYRSQIIFILFFTLSGYLIGFLLNLPAIELCVIPVVLKIFSELQDSQIYTDVLTRLYNRRRMTEYLNEEMPTCSEKDPLSIIMVDLDYFKSINDILGHDEGDKALIAFSKALKKTLSSRDAVAARWGGDEFVVAGKDKDITRDFTKKMKEALAETELPYTPQFSIGTCVCTSSDMTCEEALAKADEELYKDKEKNHQNSAGFVEELKRLSL